MGNNNHRNDPVQCYKYIQDVLETFRFFGSSSQDLKLLIFRPLEVLGKLGGYTGRLIPSGWERLWTEHSERATFASGLGALGILTPASGDLRLTMQWSRSSRSDSSLLELETSKCRPPDLELQGIISLKTSPLDLKSSRLLSPDLDLQTFRSPGI